MNRARVPLRGKKKKKGINDFKVVKWFKQLLNTGKPDFRVILETLKEFDLIIPLNPGYGHNLVIRTIF